ncbi:LTA synthase family protein [Priestia taiwanensis]|uniref:Divalent ion tolerance protein CutA n=1 Tax=Priestia taiwanensis TaxID=1347902 RepID=A0A917AQY4_9BACI|nr:LTA synthase family protein [Priestia taiwanensis]MBM7363113.1 phosphoglycerol transferase MdoB-like AlkP superfamily enzyme [Priestia taiwanensis]GGE67780.1 divalent ion tolerance protein CutA [Priestia taiwanensis]
MMSRKSNMKKSLTWVHYTMMFILPLMTVGLMEGLHRRSIGAFLHWMVDRPVEFFFTYVFVWSACAMFMAFSAQGYFIGSAVVTLLLATFAYGSSVKAEFRGEPVIPTDFWMLKEAMAVSMYVPLMTWILAALAIVGVAIGVFFISKWGKGRTVPKWVRIVMPVLAVVVMILFFMEDKVKLREQAGLRFISFEQQTNYNQNGLALAFIDNLQYLHISEPENYTEDTVKELVDKRAKSQVATTALAGSGEEKKPNVIVVMSEAFFDPTYLPNVTYSENPLPNFHRLQDEHIGGKVNVSVFGGGTANSEFEALTGMSTKYTPAGGIPYIHYVNKETPSIAWQFRQAGYDTSAMTTYHNWFYRLKDVYKYFGFNRLEGMEFYAEPEMDGYYIKDKELMKKITNQVADTEEPAFIYAVTMQGHGPYDNMPKKDKIKVNAELPDNQLEQLSYFANTMNEIDASIKQLTDDLQALDEPTIVLFFGDHLPSLGGVFEGTKFNTGGTPFEDYMRMYHTPLLIWDNYSGEKGELSMSAPFIGPYLLDRAGVEGNNLTNYLAGLFKEGHRYILAEQWFNEIKFPKEVIDEYRLLQYDMLFGERYGVTKKDIPVTEGFKQGYKGPEISTIAKDGDKLVITGTVFTEKCRVQVNGKDIQTTYVNPTTLEIEAKSAADGDKVKIQLYDSRDANIYTSAEYTF